MKVYIAGSSDPKEIRIVQGLQDMVRAAGHEIQTDWTRCEGLQRECTPAELRAFARNDLDGVRACDVFWLVAPESKSEGASVELGAALILKKRCIVSGPHARRVDRLFCLLAEIHDTHETALAAILGRPLGVISPDEEAAHGPGDPRDRDQGERVR